MNPSFQKIFKIGDARTSTPTSNNSIYIYEQQSPKSTKHMVSVQNTSDEYHTANEESFNVTGSNSMNSPLIQQRTTGMATSTSTAGATTMAARKQMLTVDQSEPAKPLSAYALFFRDTVSAIKQQNPTSSFQELSKIVASMWDVLDPEHKAVYNKKNELAKVEYLKQMRIYQQQLQQKHEELSANANESYTNDQQQATTTTTQAGPHLASNVNVQHGTHQVHDNQSINSNQQQRASSVDNSVSSSEQQFRLTNEAGVEQKCIRDNCNKRAIINPDWEDEYCSNECVIIHCRNVFNDWVQSNIEARQQQQLHVTTT